MNTFTLISDDFLSNGFHQFYNELQQDNDTLITNYNNNNNFDNYYTNCDTYFNDLVDNIYNPINDIDNLFIDNYNYDCINYNIEGNGGGNNYYQLDNVYNNNNNINTFLCDNNNNNNNNSVYNDYDLDNILADTNFKLTNELTINDNLPDRTPLCSDSCDLFIKESAENLKLATIGNKNEKNLLMSKNILQHLSTVNEDRSLTCTFGACGKVYAKPAHLKAHLRRHIGDKPYICTWPDCTWRFSRSDELARHRRSHSGIKPYKCDYCPKCFARSDHLTKHRKVHERKMAAQKNKNLWSNGTFKNNKPSTGQQTTVKQSRNKRQKS